MLTPQRYERLQRLFGSACELEPPQRSALLDRECVDDPVLRREVEALLDRDGDPSSFLESPALGQDFGLAGADDLAHRAGEFEAGDRIDGYLIRETLGEGGAAIVYLAEQKEPVRRRVALKIIKPGMDSRQVIARFEAERQALAMMDHVGVAKVFDAGATETGRPYFVMEHVPGVPITEHCDRQRSSIEERLRLFMEVCEAVQHAHQKGIIHRDLKPGNVLVLIEDGRAVPKVIDFGVAKALHQRLTERTIFTEQGQLIGTPAYMSPEQAEMTAQDIDTRSDIYALGVLLYELLTGALPFDPKPLREAAFGEILRIIRDEEPLKPSARLGGLGDDATTHAQSCRADSRSLTRELRGDLDWIVMKALEKDRVRRYGTASGLARDIRRHLEHEPVRAGPPSRAYRLRKFVRRHRTGVAAAAVVAVSLIAATIVSVGFALSEARQRQLAAAEATRADEAALRATEEKDIAQAVNRLIDQMLGSADPHRKKGPDYTVRALLDEFGGTFAGQLDDQPLVEASIRATMGRTYRNLGVPDRAEPHLRRALELRRRELGDDHHLVLESSTSWAWHLHDLGEHAEAEAILRDVLDTQVRLHGTERHGQLHRAVTLGEIADMLRHQGRYDEAEQLQREGLEIQERLLGAEDPRTLTSMHNFALLRGTQGHYAEAEALHAQVLETRKRVLGEEHPDTLKSMQMLASVHLRQGRYGEAEPRLVEVLEIQKRVLGEEHPGTRKTLNNLAVLYWKQGRYAEAEPLYLQVLESQKRVLGEEHPDTLRTMNNLAALYGDQGRTDDALAMHRRTLEVQKRVQGPEHPATLKSMHNLASMYAQHGRYDEAEALYLETVEIGERVLGAEHPDRLVSLQNLASVYSGQGRVDEAETLYTTTLETMERVLGEEHPRTLTLMSDLAILLKDQGRYDEAEPLYLETREIRQRVLGAEHPATLGTMHDLAVLYDMQGRPEEAETLLRQTIELKTRALGEEHPSTLSSMQSLAIVYGGQGRYDEAGRLFQQTLEILERVRGAEHPDTLNAMSNLGKYYMNHDRYDEAEPLLRRVLEINERVRGPEHPRTLRSMNDLAIVYKYQGRYDEAEALYLETLEITERVLGADHPARLDSMHNLAALYLDRGRSEEAESVYLRMLEIKERTLGPEDSGTLQTLHSLADLYKDSGRLEDAEALYLQSIEPNRRVLGIDHEWTRCTIDGLATVLERQGREQDALPWRREQIDYATAVAQAPGADAWAKNEAAWALLTAKQVELLDPVTALELAIEANDLTNHEDPMLLDTLSLAYHLNGDAARAVDNQKRAIALLPPGDSDLRTDMEAALAEFEAALAGEPGQDVLANPG